MATASENDTGFFNGTFSDKDGNPLTPKTAVWSLSDQNGNILDSGIIANPPTSDIYEFIIPTLEIPYKSLLKRFVMVSITYDSGSSVDLIKNEEFEFMMSDLKNIATS